MLLHVYSVEPARGRGIAVRHGADNIDCNMTYQYVIARNPVTITVPEDLEVWQKLEPRFRPFAVERSSICSSRGQDSEGDKVYSLRPDHHPTPQSQLLEIEVTADELPEVDTHWTYEPEYDGIGVFKARATLLADGTPLMEFTHVEEGSPRLRLQMEQGNHRAKIRIAPKGDGNDIFFLTHALMLAYMISSADNGTLMIHASSVIYRGKGYLFEGRSGTGKSTHASLWLRHVEGTELLNDDHPVIRFSPEGKPTVYGSPWSGKTDCYRNLSAPVGGMVRIVRGEENELVRLAPLQAYASVTASVFFLPFLSEKARDIRHAEIERLVGSVACWEMHCRPDKEAALLCARGVGAEK